MPVRVKRKTDDKISFALLAEHASNVVYRSRLGSSPSLQYINAAVTQLLGYTPEELYASPTTWAAINHPGDLPLIAALIEDRARTSGKLWMRWRHKDGRFLWVEQDIVVERTARGKAVAIEAVVREMPQFLSAIHSLGNSDALSAILMDGLPANIAIVDADGNILMVNQAWLDYAAANNGDPGRTGQGINYFAVCEAASGEDADRARAFAAGMRDVLAGKAPMFAMEYSGQAPQEQRWFLGRVTPIIDRSIVHAIVTHIEVTHVKKPQQMQLTHQAIAQTLSSTVSILNSTLDFDEVMDRILAEAGKIVPNDGATVMLVEGENARIVRLAGENKRDRRATNRLNQLIPLANLVDTETIFATRRGIVVPDVTAEPRWLSIEGAEWVRAYLAVPIVAADRVIGLLNLDSRTIGAFQEEDIHRLEIFAEYAAIAIKNAQNYEAEHFERLLAEGLQKTTETMVRSSSADELFSEILLRLKALIHCDWAAVLLVRAERLVVIASSEPSPQEKAEDISFDYLGIPLFFKPLSAAEPMTFGDIRSEFDIETLPDLGIELRSWIGVPIIVRDVIVGYLAAGSTGADAFSARDMRAAQAYTHQAALMLEHSEILSELEISRLNLDQARAQLLRTAHLHMAGEIATGIAHKVNNPLTTVIAESYLLEMSTPPDSEHQESIRAIREAAYEAGTVVQRLMDSALARPFVLEPMQVNESINNAVAMIRAQIEPHIARLTLDLSDDLPLISGSAENLRDVWLRLLLNARDAIDKPGSGRIALTSAYRPEANTVQVDVSDNGRGISSEHLDDIFKPLYTTKEHATGLGLALCNEIISKHHGVIRVDSTLNEGTTIQITFVALPQYAENP